MVAKNATHVVAWSGSSVEYSVSMKYPGSVVKPWYLTPITMACKLLSRAHLGTVWCMFCGQSILALRFAAIAPKIEITNVLCIGVSSWHFQPEYDRNNQVKN